MVEVKTKGAFKLESYSIRQFSLDEPNLMESDELTIFFDPSGIYYSEKKEYQLSLTFLALYDQQKKQFIKATVDAIFKFENMVDEIPPYFYANSIAIIFPYLRSFVTTLTSVANIKPLILPTFNLTSLESELKIKTEIK